jgi:hypothetical protein
MVEREPSLLLQESSISEARRAKTLSGEPLIVLRDYVSQHTACSSEYMREIEIF